MSEPQQRTLAALVTAGQPITAANVAARTGTDTRTAVHTLDALFRRSLATVLPDGTWTATGRGHRKAKP